MKKVFLLAVFFVILSSCDVNETYKLIKIDDKYSIEILESMTETKQLNDEASLQYQNLFKELYIIVMDEDIENVNYNLENAMDKFYKGDLEGYSNFYRDNYKANSLNYKFSNISDLKINGMEAKHFEFEGNLKEYKIFYHLTFIKGINRYYNITSWTLLDKKEKCKPLFQKSASTFKEIHKKTIAN